MKPTIKSLQAEIEQLKETIQNLHAEQWLDSADVKTKFNISDSTLARFRKNQLIPFSLLGKKYYYPQSFFTKSLKSKLVNAHLLK